MKVRKSVGFGLLALLAGCCWNCCEKPQAVIPSKAEIVATNKPQKAAAKELQLHIKEITGVTVPICAKATGSKYVFRFDPTLPVADNDESCAWNVGEKETVFCGQLSFAVSDYLENGLGVRWPDGFTICCEPSAVIQPVKCSGAWAPEVNIRNVRYSKKNSTAWDGEANACFVRRLRAGRHNPPSYGHAFTGFWSKYGKDHRDYFAMRKDGIRGPWNAKPDDLMGNVAVYAANTVNTLAMCCTSTGLVAQIIANWREKGMPEYINICENDVPGQNSCHCPACEALDVRPAKIDPKWETHYSDRYVYFGNQVVAAARKYRPDVKVSYYAYNATQDAPAKQRPDEASVVGLVPTIFTMEYIKDYVGSWSKAGAKHYFYRPNRHHYCNTPYLPLGADKHFFMVMKYIREQGSIGFDYDASNACTGSFSWIDRYMLLHGMQDPTKDYDYWENHYCQAYGAAKDDVKAYLTYWREQVWEKRIYPNYMDIIAKGKWFNLARGLEQNLGDYYKADDFAQANKFLLAAEQKKLSPSQAKALKTLRIAHDHATLFFEAVAHKSWANTRKLVDFRKKYGYPLYTWAEQYFGDITGVESLLGKETKLTADKIKPIDPSKAEIVVSRKNLKAAAEELQLHFKEITGVTVPICAKATGGKYVFRFDPSLLFKDNSEACTWTVGEKETVFRGHADFAVTDFLENGLGVRWPDGATICCEPSAVIRPLTNSGAWSPELNIRTIRYAKNAVGKAAGNTAENVNFVHRMRAGTHNPPVYGHAFTWFWNKYGKDHRDYFAMRKDGIRGPWDAKPEDLLGNVAVYAANTKAALAMCCTSTGLVAQVIANWREKGMPEYINICENDVPGQNSCHCPACEALTVRPAKVDPSWETHYSDRYVYFGNQVVAAARKYRPDVKVAYYAYNATQDAPAKQHPDEASVVGIVPTIFTMDYIKNYVGSWSKAGAKHYFYRPNRHHYCDVPYLPLGADKHFFTVMDYIRKQGSIGFDYDAGSVATGSFSWIDRYVLFHGMQDPTKDYDYWENHYCQAYGAAKDDVKAYLAYWREQVWEKRIYPNYMDIITKGKWFNLSRGLQQNLKDYYTSEDFVKANKFLLAAEQKKLNPSQAKALKTLRIAHDHATIFFEAVAHKSWANTRKLVDFRKKYGYPLYTWAEQYFGDVTGIEGLLGKEKKSDK